MRHLGWLGPLLMLAAGTGCPSKPSETQDAGVVSTGPEKLQEQEPNNKSEQALSLSRDSEVSASLGADPARPDEDWYRLAPGEAPRVVDLSLSAMPGGDVALEVYEAPGVRSATLNSEGVDKPERHPNLFVPRERWVRVYSARKGAGGAYTLSVRYRPPEQGEEQEPDDRAVDANTLALGQPITGFLGHRGDEDWYRVELPEPPQPAPPPPAPTPAPEAAPAPPQGEGTEQAQPADPGQPLPLNPAPTTPPPSTPAPPPPPAEPPSVALKIELTAMTGVRPELQVLSAAEAPLFSTTGKEGEGLSLRNIGVRATDRSVYLVVRGGVVGSGKEARRSYSPTAAYTLTVSLEEAGARAELEPNDEPFKATALPEGSGSKQGFLSPKSDVDYYVLRPSSPVLARLELSGVERVDLMLSVVRPPGEEAPKDAKEEVLLRANEGELKEPERLNSVACSPELPCYLRVEGALRKVEGKWTRDYENAEQPYTLTVSTTPDDGSQERESNGTVESASRVEFGRPVRGTVFPTKDVDYYLLDLSERAVRTPLKATLQGILKVDVGLYLHRVEGGKLTLVQTADRGKGEQPETIRYSAEPGQYVLEVRDSRNRESNFQDAYSLLVEEDDDTSTSR